MDDLSLEENVLKGRMIQFLLKEKRNILRIKNPERRISLIQAGFTLIELLIVIVIIVALAVAVFVALNPTKRLIDARNARRTTDTDSLRTAINEYMADKGTLPGIPNDGVVRQIGTGAGLSSCILTTTACSITATNCVDLTTPLVPYLKSMPQDPQIGSASATGYAVSVDSNNIVTVNACGTEQLALASTPTPTPTPTLTPTPTPTGNIWYVSKNGSNADGKSWTTAWNDLNKISWSAVNPGDTIYLDGGTTACASNYDFVATRPGVSCGMLYNSTLTIGKSGTAALPITIKLATDAGHNGTAVFFGGRATPLPYCGQPTYSPATVGTGLRVGITIGAYQYVILDGMKRSGMMIYGYDDPTHNVVNGDGLGIQFTSSSASNITIRNMEIFDNGVYDTVSKTGSPIIGTYNSDSKGIEPYGNNLTFERLLVHDNGQDEFQSGGPLSNVTIQDSWMYARRSNPLYPGFGFNSGPFSYGCTHEDGIQVYGGGAQSGLTFKNDIYGPGLDQGIYPSDSGVYFNNVSMNNILFLGAAWNNINVDAQSPTTVPQNWSIQNITAYDDSTSFDPTAGQCNLEVLSGSGNTITNSIAKNGCVNLGPSGNFTGSNNVYFNTSRVIPGGTNVDPAFVAIPATNSPSYSDYASANFTPQCSSCTGAGSSLHTYQDILNDIDQLNP